MANDSKYKIVKKCVSATLDRYVIYRKFFFFWKNCNSEWTLKEAEEWIQRDKESRERRKKKPEVIGYY